MTDTPGLSERLREFRVVVYNPDGSQGSYLPPICTEGADALDAKDARLAQAAAALEHARIFITTREKMHPEGVALHDEALAAIRAKGVS
jgi:hypothetical protein